jgi:hypothetical protein
MAASRRRAQVAAGAVMPHEVNKSRAAGKQLILPSQSHHDALLLRPLRNAMGAYQLVMSWSSPVPPSALSRPSE